MRGKSCAATVVILVFFASLMVNTANAAKSAGSVEVLYTAQAETITTFNVDPATGQAKQVGQPLQVGSGPMIWQFASAPNDHFVYVMATGTGSQETLSVYATDAQGVPQAPAVQTFTINNVLQPAANTISVDPNGKFVYVTVGRVVNGGNIASTVYLFFADPNTGKLALQNTQGSFSFSPCCGWEGPEGFNSSGTKLYEGLAQYAGGTSGAEYYYQPVDPQTGALGKYVFLLNGMYDSMNDIISVALGDPIIAESYAANQNPANSWVNVYPFESNPQNPLIHCTISMLAQCGSAWQILLDPSGEYLLVTTSSNSPYVVTRIDLTNKQLVPTGGQVPDEDESFYFSPDGTLIYMVSWGNGNPSVVQIYLFNPTNGQVTTGGQISIQATAVYAAVRD